jgi:serine/threonine protein kinase
VQTFRREALIWRQLRHPFILPLIGIDASTFGKTDFLPCLVSPLMSRGTLREYIASTDYTPQRDFYRLVRAMCTRQWFIYLRAEPGSCWRPLKV